MNKKFDQSLAFSFFYIFSNFHLPFVKQNIKVEHNYKSRM